MKGGKKGRPAKKGGAARKSTGGKLKSTAAKRATAAAPKKGSPKRPDYGGVSSKDEL